MQIIRKYREKGMRKRIILKICVVCAALVLPLCLAGCKKKDTVTIGVSIYQYSDNFMALYRDKLIEGFAEQSEKDGKTYELVMTNGNNDPIEQANQINTFIAMKVDLIILNPVLTSSCNALLDKITQAGIPCVIINREPLGNNGDESYRQILENDRVAYVGCKALQSGRMQGEIIYELADHGDVNGDGRLDYLLLKGDPENPDAQYRTLYSIGSFAGGVYDQKNARYVELCKENNVNITPNAVMEDQLGNWDQAKAEELTTNALNITGNKIEVIFANNDAMALGALTAVKKQNMKVGKDIYIVGVDGLDSVTQKIAAGEITGTVVNSTDAQSKKTVEISLHFLGGGTKQTVPHEEGKSAESEQRGYFWIDYLKYTAEK